MDRQTATTIKRLTIWRDYLVEVIKPLVKKKPHKWDMSIYASDMKLKLECTTAGCALGWATTIPSFREAGMYLDEDHYPVMKNGSSIGDFFGISWAEESRITTPEEYKKQTRNITVSDVAKRLTSLISTYKKGKGEGH